LLNIFRKPNLQPRHYFYICGSILAVACILSLIPQMKYLWWKELTAKVTFSQSEPFVAHSLYRADSVEVSVYREYKYEVAGKKYQGNSGYLSHPKEEGSSSRQSLGVIDIIYDPERPWASQPRPSFPSLEIGFLSFGMLCIVGASIATYRRKRIHERRQT
jgi:hypothetical protein